MLFIRNTTLIKFFMTYIFPLKLIYFKILNNLVFKKKICKFGKVKENFFLIKFTRKSLLLILYLISIYLIKGL